MKKIMLISMIMLTFAGCKKDKEESPTPAPESFYVSFTYDGENYRWAKGKDGCVHTTITDNNAGSGTYTSRFEHTGTNRSLSIRLQFLSFSGSKADETSFKDFFNTGSRPYIVAGVDNGVEINYYSGGPFSSWSMTSQPADFTINSRTLRKAGSKNFVDVKGSFNCVIYDNNGDPMTLTNGKFYCSFADE